MHLKKNEFALPEEQI